MLIFLYKTTFYAHIGRYPVAADTKLYNVNYTFPKKLLYQGL